MHKHLSHMVLFMLVCIACITYGVTDGKCEDEIDQRNCIDGLCLEVSSNRQVFNLSTKRIDLYVAFENSGKNRIVIDPDKRIVVHVSGVGSTPVPFPVAGPPPGIAKPIILKAKEKYTETFHDLRTAARGWEFTPGHYKVKASYHLSESVLSLPTAYPDGLSWKKEDIWTGSIDSLYIEIEYKE